jgi:hypothetical protein
MSATKPNQTLAREFDKAVWRLAARILTVPYGARLRSAPLEKTNQGKKK